MAVGILWFTHLSMKSINVYKYPIGKLRVQPVGIVIYAAVMATLGFQDHYFDVVTNVVGLAAAVIVDRFYWWIDPIGAIAPAVYTISNWSMQEKKDRSFGSVSVGTCANAGNQQAKSDACYEAMSESPRQLMKCQNHHRLKKRKMNLPNLSSSSLLETHRQNLHLRFRHVQDPY
ncbi:unnamed protein product [Urochloa humidicola]